LACQRDLDAYLFQKHPVGEDHMRQLLAAAALVLAVGCGGPSTPAVPEEATNAAAALDAHAAVAGGDRKLKGDGTGCKDKAEAVKLVDASNKEDQSEYINLWASGMQDQRCRGFSEGLGATVEKSDSDGWACIKPADDPQVDACFWIAPGRAN
jgi:hypothetical protein